MLYIHRKNTLIFKIDQWRSKTRAFYFIVDYRVRSGGDTGSGDGGGGGEGRGGGGGGGGGDCGWAKIFCVRCHSKRQDVGKAPKHRL